MYAYNHSPNENASKKLLDKRIRLGYLDGGREKRMENLYMVIRRMRTGPWEVIATFNEKRLADNFAECRIALDTEPRFEHRVAEGTILFPQSEAEVEARLGPFNAVAAPSEPVQ